VEERIRITFTGKAGAGKTLAANHLVNRYGFVKYSISSKIKEIAKDLFGMENKDRRLLQDIGTKMREIKPTVWVDYLIRQIERDTSSPGFSYRGIVVDDLRFLNEAELLRRNGFFIVKIEGITYDMGELGQHVSETELESIDPDYTIRLPQLYDDIPRYNKILIEKLEDMMRDKFKLGS